MKIVDCLNRWVIIGEVSFITKATNDLPPCLQVYSKKKKKKGLRRRGHLNWALQKRCTKGKSEVRRGKDFLIYRNNREALQRLTYLRFSYYKIPFLVQIPLPPTLSSISAVTSVATENARCQLRISDFSV